MKMDLKIFIPEIQYTTDNAAMIGIVGYLKYINSDISDLKSTPITKISLLMNLFFQILVK